MKKTLKRFLLTSACTFLVIAPTIVSNPDSYNWLPISSLIPNNSAVAQTASGGSIFRREGNVWNLLSGQAFSVAIGGNNSTWVIGTNPVPGGFGIYRWNGTGWQGIDGGAVDIAVAPNGQPWVINDQGYIFRRSNNTWQLMPGLARDIDIGQDGSVWVIGAGQVPGGFSIHRWTGSDWQRVDGGAVRIAIAPNGQPWVVNDAGHIFRRVNGTWQRMPGLARDIAIGHNGSVWVIGAGQVPGGFSIHRWTGSDWQQIDGGAVRIAVDNGGNPWVVNQDSAFPASSNVIMDEAFFLNNWRSWPQYTTQNPFPSKGRNCTWYAHGRMLQLGYSKYALDSMLGHAGTWDNTAARGAQVVNTPQVGSIAVWEASVNGAGSVGHVAVVERVNSNGTITISESNWAGKAYNVRTIPANHPSKFIVAPR
jgi:surface antigen